MTPSSRAATQAKALKPPGEEPGSSINAQGRHRLGGPFVTDGWSINRSWATTGTGISGSRAAKSKSEIAPAASVPPGPFHG